MPDWQVVKGFAVFERVHNRRAAASSFVAIKHWWLRTLDGTWVDVTPLTANEEPVLLVESELGDKVAVPLSAEGQARACRASAMLLECQAARQPDNTEPSDTELAVATEQRLIKLETMVKARGESCTLPPAATEESAALPAVVDGATTSDTIRAVQEASVELGQSGVGDEADVQRVMSRVDQLGALAAAAGEGQDWKYGSKIGPFGEMKEMTPISDDVLLLAALDLLHCPSGSDTRQVGTNMCYKDLRALDTKRTSPEAAYLKAALALLNEPTEVLHAGLHRYLAPCRTFAGLMGGPAAKSETVWLRVKTLVGAKALLDDERIDRGVLPELLVESTTVTRSDWAHAFGVALPHRSTWPVESVRAGEQLRERVRALPTTMDGPQMNVHQVMRLDSFSVVELLQLLRPQSVPVWHTAFACFGQAFSHHAEILTTEGVCALARYLKKRQQELGGSLRSIVAPIIEVGAGTGRLAHLLNRTRILPTAVIATDIHPLGSAYAVETMDASAAIAHYKPLLVVCAWMSCGQDWTCAWREKGVSEYILIGSYKSSKVCTSAGRMVARDTYSLSRSHAPYETVPLDAVSRHLLGVADVLPSGGPFGDGGSVCAVAYRRPVKPEPRGPRSSADA